MPFSVEMRRIQAGASEFWLCLKRGIPGVDLRTALMLFLVL